MSLRLRVLAAVAVVLIAGAAGAVALAGWQARQVLTQELTLALVGGRQTAVTAFEALPRAQAPWPGLVSLTATFDDSRHVRAVLVDDRGRLMAQSHPAATSTAPAWFTALLRPPIDPVVLRPPVDGVRLVLEPVFANDIAADWAEFLDLVAVLSASLAAGALLVWMTVGRALGPLRLFSDAFAAIGSGDYAARAPEGGPAELANLGRSVNHMAARLGAMRSANQALEAQLRTLQDEERADLARDLHDEIGPHLFAAHVDVALAQRLIGEGRSGEALAPLATIEAAVAHIQQLVRDILRRLRPTELVELGLAGALAELVVFWRARQPATEFVLDAPDEDSIPPALRETVYRVAQEGLNNAVRHGAPSRVAVGVGLGPDRSVRVSVEDNGRGPGMAAGAGMGLKGMRERVEAAGGTLRVAPAPDGWTIEAAFPPPARTAVAA
ncbi:MAG TPA: histidine kinase [Caulobacteraceae bacterium]|nr:histidine kinase [Caulobacteraceae bacterium]